MREGVNHWIYTGTPGMIHMAMGREKQEDPKARRQTQKEDGNGRLLSCVSYSVGSSES